MGEMSNIAESLRDVAEDMSLDPRIPRSVLRRARRRRVRTALITAALGAAVAAGGVVGVRSITGAFTSPDAVRPAEPQPVPTRVPKPTRGLPRSVEETRQAIVTAATDRDWNRLEGLIPNRGFTYSIGDSIGGGTEAVAFWQQLEETGDAVLETLVEFLEGPWGVTRPGAGVGGAVTYRGEVIYQWPAASAKHPRKWTSEDIEQLRTVATREELRQYRRHGYFGWRVGIAADGEWLFYVAGD